LCYNSSRHGSRFFLVQEVNDMRLGVMRPHILLGMCLFSMMALWFSVQRPTSAQISVWRPGAPVAPVLMGAAAPFLDAPPAANTAPGMAASSVPLGMGGDVGFNVRAALDASGGALRRVLIRPGETWSFNAAVGDPAQVEVRTIGGIPGGGWCDLASRYVQAVRSLLPESAVRFRNHMASTGIGLLDVADADTVAIWNIDGQPGTDGSRGDLQITNMLPSPLRLEVLDLPGEQIVVRALVG
jgi:hypothetical protein